MNRLVTCCAGLLAGALVAAATACAGAPPALELAPGCTTAQNRTASIDALVVALESKRWVVRAVDYDNGTVAARATRGRNRVSIEATIGASGQVTVRRLGTSPYGRNPWRLPRNWVRHLRHAYEAFSCYEPERLRTLASRRSYPTRVPPAGEWF